MVVSTITPVFLVLTESPCWGPRSFLLSLLFIPPCFWNVGPFWEDENPKILGWKKETNVSFEGGNVAISFRALQKTKTHTLLRLLTFQIERQVWTNYPHLGRGPPLWISHRRVVLWNCPPFSHPETQLFISGKNLKHILGEFLSYNH